MSFGLGLGLSLGAGAQQAAAVVPDTVASLFAAAGGYVFSAEDLTRMWQDVARTTAVQNDGDAVRSIREAADYDYLQGATAWVYGDAENAYAINGKPVVYFAGAEDIGATLKTVKLLASYSTDTRRQWNVLIVFKAAGTRTDNKGFGASVNDQVALQRWRTANGGSIDGLTYEGTVLSDSIVVGDDGAHLYVQRSSGTACVHSVDDGAEESLGVVDASFADIALPLLGASFMAVACVGVVPLGAEQTDLKAALMAYYGIA